eukprot:3586642-Pleurochrysis_carterae.AAC.2
MSRSEAAASPRKDSISAASVSAQCAPPPPDAETGGELDARATISSSTSCGTVRSSRIVDQSLTLLLLSPPSRAPERSSAESTILSEASTSGVGGSGRVGSAACAPRIRVSGAGEVVTPSSASRSSAARVKCNACDDSSEPVPSVGKLSKKRLSTLHAAVSRKSLTKASL